MAEMRGFRSTAKNVDSIEKLRAVDFFLKKMKGKTLNSYAESFGVSPRIVFRSASPTTYH